MTAPFRIGVVCLGNICRSPIADVVINRLLQDADQSSLDVEVTSCGTGDWHVGEPMDPRAARVLARSGYDPSRHRARTFGPDWFEHDLLLTMDRSNFLDVLEQLPSDRHERVHLFREFDPEWDGHAEPPDLPDPWYGGPQGFEDVLAMVERTAAVLVERLPGLVSSR